MWGCKSAATVMPAGAAANQGLAPMALFSQVLQEQVAHTPSRLWLAQHLQRQSSRKESDVPAENWLYLETLLGRFFSLLCLTYSSFIFSWFRGHQAVRWLARDVRDSSYSFYFKEERKEGGRDGRKEKTSCPSQEGKDWNRVTIVYQTLDSWERSLLQDI